MQKFYESVKKMNSEKDCVWIKNKNGTVTLRKTYHNLSTKGGNPKQKNLQAKQKKKQKKKWKNLKKKSGCLQKQLRTHICLLIM